MKRCETRVVHYRAGLTLLIQAESHRKHRAEQAQTYADKP